MGIIIARVIEMLSCPIAVLKGLHTVPHDSLQVHPLGAQDTAHAINATAGIAVQANGLNVSRVFLYNLDYGPASQLTQYAPGPPAAPSVQVSGPNPRRPMGDLAPAPAPAASASAAAAAAAAAAASADSSPPQQAAGSPNNTALIGGVHLLWQQPHACRLPMMPLPAHLDSSGRPKQEPGPRWVKSDARNIRSRKRYQWREPHQ